MASESDDGIMSYERAFVALEQGRTNRRSPTNSRSGTIIRSPSMPGLTSYTCKTQAADDDGCAVSITQTSYPDSSQSDGEGNLVLGIGHIVPRWDVSSERNLKLQYYVQADTFPSAGDAQLAASNLQLAADEWNKLNIGITITPTRDQAVSNFYLVYKKSKNRNSKTLAKAFFPNEYDEDLVVYKFAFEPANKRNMKNIFMHELGHVLGLRHEFAVAGDSAGNKAEGHGAVQFMDKNPLSIMSYTFPPTLQQSDKDGIQAFYRLKNGYEIDGSAVTDFLPQVRTQI